MAAPSPRDALRWASGSRGTLTQRKKNDGTAPGAEIWSMSAQQPPSDLQLDAGHKKGHKHSYTGDALDRLEDWLGLKSGPSAQIDAPALRPGPSRSAPPKSAPTGRVDVLVHEVAPTDTLEGISLRYGADAHIVRRSNKLWPGDAVQMREQLYIPLASCRWRPPHAPSQTMQRHADGSLHAVQGAHDAEAPNTDEWQLQSVETDQLKFFAGERARPARGIPTGPMGDSGLDDLLEWQDAQRESMALRPAPSRAPEPPVPRAPRDPTWQPNKRTLGAKAPERPPVDEADEPSLLQLEDPEPETAAQRTDLFRGTLPNSGAAAHWMRPIHESLPAHAPQARGPRPANASQLLSGVMSGRVRVEEAVGAAMNELRQAVNRGPRRPREDGALLPW
ncbi:hypothetical protein MCAP1_000838 [Malassezia caprae]|uniref:LysM domain-containing protein n=1 Tax=Malassezia caprae TaxID=1381934 RepID=A0AAF0E9M4_9BASI|nr:hypothetical protein MCAP1_000838 [Malassezia caprae]